MANLLRMLLGLFPFVMVMASGVGAQERYPSHTVRIVVPTSAGGVTDVLGRIIAQGLTQTWGQPVIVDNRPGADNRDLRAEFYLQTCETVFIRHALPNGTMTHRGIPIKPEKIRRVALMTVEGENDDISGVGQTEAAHRLCVNIPEDRKFHWLQPEVGHYGVFNGSRFRADIAPRISDFVLTNNGNVAQKQGGSAKSGNGATRALNGQRAERPVRASSAS